VAPAVRWLAAPIALILLTGFVLLYLWPDDSGRLFAWPIAPRMTPLVMGAGYLAGAYFWTRVLLERRWHRVGLGFLPTTVFTWAMLLATVLHWDRFSHGHPIFVAWTAIYVVAPIVIPLVWLCARAADPGTPERDDVLVPQAVRWGAGALGAAVLLRAALMFLVPAPFVAAWPWKLTPLTARVLAGWFMLPGLEWLLMGPDGRWSAWRITYESAALGFALILLGVGRAWTDFDTGNPLTWVYLGSLVGSLVALPALYLAMESRRPRHGRPPAREVGPAAPVGEG
jgi:hypothetical protein